jgi:D-3-phosphoglycerate dehydrogenase
MNSKECGGVVSRTREKDKAMAIIRLDDEAPAEALDTLRSHPDILSAQQFRL